MYTIAEEAGLVAIEINPSFTGPSCKTTRLRFRPPSTALREDGRVHDLAGARAVIATQIVPAVLAGAPAGVSWTDTVVGNGRVTVSFATRSASAAARLESAARAPLGWSLEEVLANTPASRLKRLVDDAALYARTTSAQEKRRANAVARRLVDRPRPPSFSKQAGLADRLLTLKNVKAALSALSDALPMADVAVRAALGPGAEQGQVRLSINAHPRSRVVGLSVSADEDDVPLGDAIDLVLAEFFDAPLEELRRVCGVLWAANLPTLKAPRITLYASS